MDVSKITMNLNKYGINFLIPFAIYLSIIIIYHIFINPNFGDDISFAQYLEVHNNNYLDFIGDRYNTWSSRWFVEAILVTVAKFPILWKILDVCVFAVIAICISYLTNNIFPKKFNWIVFLFILLYPLLEMRTAGWIATTLNYLWPLAALLICCTLFKVYQRHKRLSLVQYIVFFVCLIFATNIEQGAGIAFLLLIYLFIYFRFKKCKIPKFLIISFVLTIISLVSIFVCPGNTCRILSETGSWLPSFVDWTILDKLVAGVIIIGKELLAHGNLLYLGFCIGLFILLILSKKRLLSILISTIPIIIWVPASLKFLSGKNDIIEPISPFLSEVINNVSNVIPFNLPKDFTMVPYTFFETFLPVLVTVIVIAINVYCIIILSSRRNVLPYITVLGVGIVSYLVLCLSPTIYATGPRAAIFMNFSLICVICHLYSSKIKQMNQIQTKLGMAEFTVDKPKLKK